MSTTTGFIGSGVALILLVGGSALGGVANVVTSLSEPACLVLTGCGFLLGGRVCARWNGRPDARAFPLVSRVCLLLLASVLTLSCAKDPEVAKREYLKSGDTYFAEQKYKEAIVEYRNAVHQDPRFGEVRYKLAETYVRAGNPEAAYREYMRAADLMPGNLGAQLEAGQMQLRARRFDEAKARADRLLASEPLNVQAQILRGNALAGLKDLESAIVQMEEAVKLNPDRSPTYESLGVLELAKGDREAAEEAFTEAVTIDDRSVSARVALAIFYLSVGKSREAEDALEQALAIDPSNPTANRGLAVLYLTSNRAREAERYLKTVADVSKTTTTDLALADYYTLMNRSTDAVHILNGVRADDSQAFAAAQTRLAAIGYAQGQTREAHKRLDDILARRPKDSTALLMKARFLLAEGRLDDALAQARAATGSDATFAQAHFLLGTLYAATSRPDAAAAAFTEVVKLNPHAAAAHIELSRLQLVAGNAEGSIQSARHALESQPDNPGVHLLLARSLIAHNDLAQAETEMKALLSGYPNESAVHSQIGILHLAKGDQRAAKRSFERALAIDGHSLEALSGLVSLDLTAKKTAEARARLETRLTQSPRNARLLMLAASAYAVMGHPDRAEHALRQAVEIEPGNVEAQTMLAHLFMSQQKLEQAKAHFDALAKRHPDSDGAIDAQTMVAAILQRQNRASEAQHLYEQILAASPRAVMAANNLAWLYVERGGNLDVALGLAQTAAQQAPDQPEINHTLGWIYYQKGLPGQAIAALQRSVEKDPTNPVYHYHLGLAHLKHGDGARAKQSFEKALTLNPGFEGSSDARQVLASLTD